MSKPFYTAAAAVDLEAILEYIARDKPAAAMEWVERIEARCIAIAKAPQSGERMYHLGQDVRASVLRRYMIFHRHVEGRLEILRVIPGGPDVQQL